MARGVNKVILVGNLGGDPEVKYTGGGTAVCTLSAATSENWKDKQTGEQQERTEWHRVKMFGRLAEIAGEDFQPACGVEGFGNRRKDFFVARKSRCWLAVYRAVDAQFGFHCIGTQAFAIHGAHVFMQMA